MSGGWRHRLRHFIVPHRHGTVSHSHGTVPHSHDSAGRTDAAMDSSRAGMRALWISLLELGVTALLQSLVYLWSGSVALLGDTLHNVADALTAVPLGVAFLRGR